VLALSVSTPVHGKLGDLFGRKRAFMAALLLFATGSALCGTSDSMAALIVFRALQGLGAGGLVVNSQAIIGDLLAPAERGRYQGFMQATFALATVSGPLLGGMVTERLNWRWIFYINLPVCAIALIVVGVAFKLPRHGRDRPRIDWLGIALLSVGATALILLTNFGGTAFSWFSVPAFGLALVSVIALVLFLLVERRVREPVVPLRLFGNRIVRSLVALGFLTGFMTLGVSIFAPLFQQLVDGVSPTMSGLRMAPLWLTWALGSAVCGRIISRIGRYRRFPIAGTLMLSIGMLILTLLDTSSHYAVQAAGLAAAGTGLGMISSVLVLAAQNAVEHRDIGVATSTITFSRALGAAIGVTVFGAVFNAGMAGALRHALPPGVAGRPGESGTDLDRRQIDALPADLRSDFLTAFETALHAVFLTGVVVALAAFAISLTVRDIPLRTARPSLDQRLTK
jgi:EmrB/QacA subfamily drug resistance transporter